MTTGWPSAAPTRASPIPVLPAVPSTTVPPGFNAPEVRAARTMDRAARSLIEPPGFMNSALPRISHPVWSDRRFSRTRGVFPIRSMTDGVADKAVLSGEKLGVA